MGIDILGIDIMGVDILGIDIPAPTRWNKLNSYMMSERYIYKQE